MLIKIIIKPPKIGKNRLWKKLLKINSVLDEIYTDFNELSIENLSINKIENNFKIFLNVDKEFTKIEQENLLLNLEIKLKKLTILWKYS